MRLDLSTGPKKLSNSLQTQPLLGKKEREIATRRHQNPRNQKLLHRKQHHQKQHNRKQHHRKHQKQRHHKHKDMEQQQFLTLSPQKRNQIQIIFLH